MNSMKDRVLYSFDDYYIELDYRKDTSNRPYDVYVVRDNLRTLGHLKMTRSYKAENGRPGEGARCFGRNGRDVEIPVPPGTVIRTLCP